LAVALINFGVKRTFISNEYVLLKGVIERENSNFKAKIMAGLSVSVTGLFAFQIIAVNTLDIRQEFTEKYYISDLGYYDLILGYL
jgi:hypothetical protein